MASGLLFTGEVTIRLEPKFATEFTLHLHLPSWSEASRITLNGDAVNIQLVKPVFEPTAQGFDPRLARFLPIRRVWSAGDALQISFDLPIVLRRAHPKVKGHQKKTALTSGPLVYCLESVDNPGVDIFACRLEPSSLKVEFATAILGGIWVLRGQDASGRPLTFIPYHLWANRGESQMTVWVDL